MSSMRTGRGSDQFILRFPEGMRDEIKAAAEKSGRSINSEIITRMEASLAGATGSGGGDAVDQIFVNTIDRLIKNAAISDRHTMGLVAQYEQYKINRIHDLREFLDRVSDLMKETKGAGATSLEEELARGHENELAHLRSWANAWGYDIVRREDDDTISGSEILPMKNIIEGTSKKKP